MNHVNWVQQDPDFQTQYHVLKWDSSHFHEPQARRVADSALPKEEVALAVSANRERTEIAQIGFGLSSSVRSGGFALGHGQDAVIISAQGVEQQNGENVSQTVEIQQAGMREEVAISNAVVEQMGYPGEYDKVKSATVTEESNRQVKSVAAAGGQGNIRNRLKESAAQLRETYQRQKEKIKRISGQTRRVDEQKDMLKKGTREADREETLSMQAQNHYLLDSYDRKGQYSVLGK